MKQKDIIAAYGLLKDAKLTKMEAADKFKVIKLAHEYKLISEAYDSFRQDAVEKLKEDYPDYDENLRKAQTYEKCREYERLKATGGYDKAKEEGKLPISDEEYEKENGAMGKADYDKFIGGDFHEYFKAVEGCLKDESGKDITPKSELLTEDAFGKLLESNDWSTGQAMSVIEVTVKQPEDGK